MDIILDNPKYVDAVTIENSYRDTSFIFDYEYIQDIKVYQLTPKLLALLSFLKNPYITGGKIESEHILSLLDVIRYDKTVEKQLFYQSVIKSNDINILHNEIIKYLEDSFVDSLGDITDNGIYQPSYFSSIASIVDIFASNYHWTEQDILNLPYRRIYQYLRILRIKNDNKTILFNKFSDKAKAEIIKQYGS